MITVVGLGAEEGDLTENGKRAILEAKRVIARTALTRSYRNLAALGVEHTCLDEVYKRSRSFSTLNKNLAAEVAEIGRRDGILRGRSRVRRQFGARAEKSG